MEREVGKNKVMFTFPVPAFRPLEYAPVRQNYRPGGLFNYLLPAYYADYTRLAPLPLGFSPQSSLSTSFSVS